MEDSAIDDTQQNAEVVQSQEHIMEIVEEFGIVVFERIKKLSFPNLGAERLQQISIKDIESANIP